MLREVISLLFFYMTGMSIGGALAHFPCPKWLYAATKFNASWVHSYWAKSMVEFAEISEGMAILHIGCGYRSMKRPLSNQVGDSGSVLGIDTPERLHWSETESFDCAILVTMLGDLPNREKALQQVYGLLRPGGKLVILESVIDPHFHSKDLVTELATRAGFIEVNTKGNFLTYSVAFAKNVENAA